MGTDDKKKDRSKILIVDDVFINLEMLKSILEDEGYEALCAQDVKEAIEILDSTLPHLILSDISMPGMDGMEFCRLLKSNPKTKDIPLIFITVLDSSEEKEKAFMAGAADFILKPFEKVEVIMRVRNQVNIYRMKKEMDDYNRMMHQMVGEQQKTIEDTQKKMLFALAKVIEKRDVNTGAHLDNIAYNSRMLAQSLQLLPQYEDQISDEFVEAISSASSLHDVGNLAVPDSVFLKDGPLNADEMGIIRTHVTEGAKVLREIQKEWSDCRFMDMAIEIAQNHHERWDGKGYPAGLKGTEIPLSARIVSLIDTFDVLTGTRVYKKALSFEKSLEIINEDSGKAFDPEMVQIFNKVWKRMKLNSEVE